MCKNRTKNKQNLKKQNIFVINFKYNFEKYQIRYIYFLFSCGFIWIVGHTQKYLRLTPGSLFREQTCWDLGYSCKGYKRVNPPQLHSRESSCLVYTQFGSFKLILKSFKYINTYATCTYIFIIEKLWGKMMKREWKFFFTKFYYHGSTVSWSLIN